MVPYVSTNLKGLALGEVLAAVRMAYAGLVRVVAARTPIVRDTETFCTVAI